MSKEHDIKIVGTKKIKNDRIPLFYCFMQYEGQKYLLNFLATLIIIQAFECHEC